MTSLGARDLVSKIAFKYVAYVALPLLLAVAIYLVFRSDPPTLLMALMDQLSMTHRPIRLESNFDWMVYNVPDALWAFSFTSFLLIACRHDRPAIRKAYLAFGSILMVGLEVAQGIYLTGTYDDLDVVATAAGAGLSYLMLYRSAHQ
jgi:hypothetical protein